MSMGGGCSPLVAGRRFGDRWPCPLPPGIGLTPLIPPPSQPHQMAARRDGRAVVFIVVIVSFILSPFNRDDVSAKIRELRDHFKDFNTVLQHLRNVCDWIFITLSLI